MQRASSFLAVIAAAAIAGTTCQARPQQKQQVFVSASSGRSGGLPPPPPPPRDDVEATTAPAADAPNAKPVMSQFLVRSDVQFRYARTRVESYVKNPASVAQPIAFSLVIPDRAFVSNFSMLIGEEEFVAEVKEKEAAKETFDDAVGRGAGAGLVEQDARDANLITVQTNVEPGSKVRFALTYEEMLDRKLGRYEHVVHVNPGQVIDNFRVDVRIEESLPVEQVRVPKLKTDPNSITSQDPNPLAQVVRNPDDPSKVRIQFVADRAAQKELSAQGVNGQFIVQYDVDGQGEAGDIQLLDGYFVHFFSPDNLDTLPKHVVFVLDVSGSMYGTKLDQTKDAMVTVLDDMSEKDYFNIITFSDEVYHWSPLSERHKEAPHNITFRGTEEIREEALAYALQLNTIGGTNINDGMVAALQLIKDVKRSEELPANVRPMVIFLTDGEATTGVVNGDEIMANVRVANKDLEVPVYGLAFGDGADFGLIKKLSLSNGAFARRIYEGSDAAIQLEDFYAQIASPLLADVEFDYVGEAVQNASLTNKNFTTFNRGNELVVAGKIDDDGTSDEVEVVIKGKGNAGGFEKRIRICLRPMPMPHPPELPPPMPKELDSSEEMVEPLVSSEEEDDSAAEGIHPPFPTRHPPFPFPDHCIQLPPRKPREPRSEHENFIERLWAFLSIKEYLDEKPTKTQERRKELLMDVSTTTTTTSAPGPKALPVEEEEKEEEEAKLLPAVILPPTKEKTNREKAIDLALRYNFVTPVTSLVVTRPDENATETVDPVPVAQHQVPGCRHCQFSMSISSRSGPRPMLAVGPRIVGGGGGGGGFGAGSMFRNKMARRPPPPPRTSRPPPPPSPTFSLASHSGHDYYDDYEVEESDQAFMLDSDMDYGFTVGGGRNRPTTTSTTPKTTCSGKIVLYSKTYRRGDKVELNGDLKDLSELDFDNRLKSVAVEGDCCWRIFTDAGFSGGAMLFRANNVYDSATKLSLLVNKASSVQKVVRC